MALRLVLDTQVWLDWLVFDDPGTRRLRNAVHLGRARICIDAARAAELARLPQCRDPDDQKFIEAAVAARADALLTKDRALLELNRRRARALAFRILKPADFDKSGPGS